MTQLQIDQIRQVVRLQLAGADLSLEGMRANVDALGLRSPAPAGFTREADDADGVPVEWIRPEGADSEYTLLYFHGGGYMLGSLDSSRNLVARIALATGAQVLSVAYRLAPEHPFPAASDDAITAYRWLINGGITPAKLVLAGTSAGAGLALATALRVRDRSAELDLPAAIICMSAWLDLGCSSDSLANADDPLCQKDPVQMMAQAYLAGHDASEALASPLHAELKGLPRLLLQAGGAEALRDENEAFSVKAREAGVDVTLEIWDEMIHAWHVFAPMLDEAQRAIASIGEFVRALD